MVGEVQKTSIINLTKHNIGDLLSSKQLDGIIEKYTKTHQYTLEKLVLKNATDGLAGYLGDHLRFTVVISVDGKLREIKLFIKCMPKDNQPKVDFLKKNLFYNREMFVVNELLKGSDGCSGPQPWRPEVYVCTEQVVAMPDLAVDGYTMRDKKLYFDVDHCILALSAMASYHATSVDYETNESRLHGGRYNILEKFGDVLLECNFKESPWLCAGSRTTVNFLGTFSKKYYRNSEHYEIIETNLEKKYIEACDSIRAEEDTFNVVIHKDMWSNNVMFKYDGSTPVNAVILDFQCVRYAPPAFDIAIFLYLNTSRSFRAAHERELLVHYYESFMRALSPASVARLKGYTLESLTHYVETSRQFALLVPVMIFPYVLMDAVTAQRTYDDPATYQYYNDVDRSEPVISYAMREQVYRDKILEVYEEFVEKFVLSSCVEQS